METVFLPDRLLRERSQLPELVRLGPGQSGRFGTENILGRVVRPTASSTQNVGRPGCRAYRSRTTPKGHEWPEHLRHYYAFEWVLHTLERGRPYDLAYWPSPRNQAAFAYS